MPTGYMTATGPMMNSNAGIFSGIPSGSGGSPTDPTGGTPYGLYWGGSGAMKGFQQGLSRNLVGRTQREQGLSGLYDNALANPTGTADLFGKYFQQAAQGYAAPLMRDFTGALSGVAGNVARRFGGNGSSEENRASSLASDLFSRNLSESLAQLAPQQVQAGLAYTGQLGQAQQAAAGQSDILKELLLGSLGQTQGQGSGLNIGSILGSVGGTLLGGPLGGVIGNKLGGLFGGGGGGNADLPI